MSANKAEAQDEVAAENATPEAAKPKEKKSRIRIFIRIAVVILAIIMAICAYVYILNRPYDRTVATFCYITVEKGDTTTSVAEKLEDEDIIGSAKDFRFYCKLMQYNGRFKAGHYYLSPSMTKGEIARTFVNGITTNSGFTIPAGYTVKQVADALEQAGYVDMDKFLEAATDTDFSYFNFLKSGSGERSEKSIKNLEGFLLPGTYQVEQGSDEVSILITMLNEFDNFWNEENQARASEMGMSVRDIVTIASMIETETTIDKERADLSSVIYNRLKAGLGFSEYKGGFPAYPLCSPSIASLEAALNPAATDYIYCVHSDKLDGTHKFTATQEEYEVLKQAYEAALEAKKSQK